MELRFKGLGFTTTLYTAPISPKGWLAAWKGRHVKWKHGFVVRVLWLGFVLRWARFNDVSWKYWMWEAGYADEPH